MALDTRNDKQTRRAPLRRRKSNPIRPLAWPLGESEPAAVRRPGRIVESTRRVVRRHAVVADQSLPATKRSLLAEVVVRIRFHPGHRSTPSQQVLESIAPSSYFLHR